MTEHNCDDGVEQAVSDIVDQLVEAFTAAGTSRHEANLDAVPPTNPRLRQLIDEIAGAIILDTVTGVLEVMTDLQWLKDAINAQARVVANVTRAEQCTDECRDDALDVVRAARYVTMLATGYLDEGDGPQPVELEIAPRPFPDEIEPYLAAIAHCAHNVHYWVRPTPAQVARWEAAS